MPPTLQACPRLLRWVATLSAWNGTNPNLTVVEGSSPTGWINGSMEQKTGTASTWHPAWQTWSIFPTLSRIADMNSECLLKTRLEWANHLLLLTAWRSKIQMVGNSTSKKNLIPISYMYTSKQERKVLVSLAVFLFIYFHRHVKSNLFFATPFI